MEMDEANHHDMDSHIHLHIPFVTQHHKLMGHELYLSQMGAQSHSYTRIFHTHDRFDSKSMVLRRPSCILSWSTYS